MSSVEKITFDSSLSLHPHNITFLTIHIWRPRWYRDWELSLNKPQIWKGHGKSAHRCVCVCVCDLETTKLTNSFCGCIVQVFSWYCCAYNWEAWISVRKHELVWFHWELPTFTYELKELVVHKNNGNRFKTHAWFSQELSSVEVPIPIQLYITYWTTYWMYCSIID